MSASGNDWLWRSTALLPGIRTSSSRSILQNHCSNGDSANRQENPRKSSPISVCNHIAAQHPRTQLLVAHLFTGTQGAERAVFLLGCALVVLVAPRQRQALERLLDLAQAEDLVDSLQPFLPHAEFNRADDGGNIARKEFLFGDQFREGANVVLGDIPNYKHRISHNQTKS